MALDYIERTLLPEGIAARVALLPAGSRGDDIIVGQGGEALTFPTLRRVPSTPGDTPLALSDFFAPLSPGGQPVGYAGLFAFTHGNEVE